MLSWVAFFDVITGNEHNIINNKFADACWVSEVQTIFRTPTFICHFLHPCIPASCQQILGFINSGFLLPSSWLQKLYCQAWSVHYTFVPHDIWMYKRMACSLLLQPVFPMWYDLCNLHVIWSKQFMAINYFHCYCHRHSVSNHRKLHRVFNTLFSLAPQEIIITVLGLGYPSVIGGFPYKGPVIRKAFPHDDVCMLVKQTLP